MKNFLRSLRYSWTYRTRLVLSIVCAVVVAVLWSLNLTAIYPVLKVLTNDTTLQQWVDECIEKSQTRIAELRQRLDLKRQELDYHQRKVNVQRTARDDEQELRLVAAITRLESELNSQARQQYGYQQLKYYVIRWLPNDRFLTLAWLMGLVTLAVAVKGVFEFFHESLVGSIVHRTLFDLRNRFFRNAIHLDVDQFNQQGTHELMARFTNDMDQLGNGIKTLYGRVIAEPLRAIGCVIVACWFCWQLTLVFLVLVPVALVVLTKVSRSMKRASRRLLERMSDIYKILQETFSGVRIVKGFTRESHERRRFHAATREYYRRAMRMVYIDAATSPVMELFGIVAVLVALLIGAYLVMEGKTHLFGLRMTSQPLDAEGLLQLYALLAAIADPVRKLSSVYTKLQSGAAAADRIFAFMDRRPLVTTNPDGQLLPPLPSAPPPSAAPHEQPELAEASQSPASAGVVALPRRHGRRIEFREVCFSYTPGRPVLHQVSLTIEPGEVVAFVGKNGCGKSTLLGMLPRFYDPDYGEVCIDGIDLRYANLRCLRREVGLVTQQMILFDDTIYNNIAYAKRRATPDEVESAARRAHVHSFIQQLPDGYQTRVGEGAKLLSGGQVQRIALARAILRDPSVLILDEFTSQIDAESEADIHSAMHQFMRTRTTLVITHRLNTLEIADRIVVMDAGRIVAVGNLAELLNTCEVYQRLHDAHFQRRAG
jgi:subfamily B ATP-binding cassette protein MsbA